MKKIKTSFECISGVLLWGQLHTVVEGHLSMQLDSPERIPSPLPGGTITQRNYHYRVKAQRGQWTVAPIFGPRHRKCKISPTIGYILFAHDVDPVATLQRCADVGASIDNDHDDDRIVYVNRYDWGWHHNPVKEARRLSKDMYSARLIMVDANAELADLKKRKFFNGVHLTVDDTEYELGWMVFDSEDTLIAFVYDGAYTKLEDEFSLNELEHDQDDVVDDDADANQKPVDPKNSEQHLLLAAEQGDIEARYALAKIYADRRHLNRDAAIQNYSEILKYFRTEVALGKQPLHDVMTTVEWAFRRIFLWRCFPKTIFPENEILLTPNTLWTALSHAQKLNSSMWSEYFVPEIHRYFYTLFSDQNQFKLVDEGDAAAQNAVGFLYLIDNVIFKSSGYEQRAIKAVELFTLAAAQGHESALLTLTLMYVTGLGVTKNLVEAIRLNIDLPEHHQSLPLTLSALVRNSQAEQVLKDAAANGDVDAMTNLAYIYLYGEGVEKCTEQALRYAHRAAEKGSAKAYRYLGRIYDNGLGVDVDVAQADKFYEHAEQCAKQKYGPCAF